MVMKVELTEEQISLLKACTAAQQQLLRDEVHNNPASRDRCWEQINDCRELHGVLTDAQAYIRRARL